MTSVYFIRHGIAAEHGTYANDDDRPLTPRGQVRTAAVAERLRSLEVRFEQVLTSPLIRAAQTAEILQRSGLTLQTETFAPLAPGGAIADWLSWLTTWQSSGKAGPLALVGHEPDLTDWAKQLVGAASSQWQLKKAGIIGLAVPTVQALGKSQLFLLVPPRFLV